MRFIFLLLLLPLSYSSGCILHKNIDLESRSSHSYFIDSTSLFYEILINKIEIDIDYSPMLSIERQSKVLLNIIDITYSNVLNKDKIIDSYKKENWYEKNKENLNFIYGATILFVVYAVAMRE